MPGFPDRSVLQVTLTISGLITVLNVAVEVWMKTVSSAPHIGTSSYYLFLGAEPEHLSPTPWLILVTLGQISAFTGALIVYNILKSRFVEM